MLDSHFYSYGFLNHHPQFNLASSGFTHFSHHDIFQMNFELVILYLKFLTTSHYSNNKEQDYVNVLRVMHDLTLSASPGSFYAQNTTFLFTLWSPTILASCQFQDHAIPTALTGPEQMEPLSAMFSPLTLTLITPHHPSDLRDLPMTYAWGQFSLFLTYIIPHTFSS